VRLYLRSLSDVSKDIVTPLVHVAWPLTYSVLSMAARPVILTEILLTEKFDQDFG
jgi:hypothetical protein